MKSYKVVVSPNAETVLQTRRGQDAPRALLANAIILRYRAIVEEQYPVIMKKFTEREQMELLNLFVRNPEKMIWMYDQSSDVTHFCTKLMDAMKQQSLKYLDQSEANKLLDIIGNHLSTTEFLSLCDWIGTQKTAVSKFNV